jgi:hypothetical protein
VGWCGQPRKVARSAPLGLQHVADRPLNVRQAFLLADIVECPDAIAAASVRHHHAWVVSRNDLLAFLVAKVGVESALRCLFCDYKFYPAGFSQD